jgi:hypothetical protein
MLKIGKTTLELLKKVHLPGMGAIIRLFLIVPRVKIACNYLLPNLGLAVRWIFESKETTNFSYDLTPVNKLYMANIIGIVTGQSVVKIEKYIKEVENNSSLKKHIKNMILISPDKFRLGPLVAYGRRIGWYALIRAVKPKVIVESGVEQGLGSCIICEALKMNKKEGYFGEYFGIDITPDAGAFFTEDYKEYGKILYGDSIKTLKNFKYKVNVYINDSDHHFNYEAKEYQTIQKLLDKDSYVLGDNSSESPELCKFAERTGRRYTFFKEQPANHWYPGSGIGFAFGKH